MKTLPGQYLGQDLIAGEGCYIRNGNVYASRMGDIQTAGNEISIPAKVNVQVGMKAIGKVLKITTKAVLVQLLAIGNQPIDLQAQILHKDTILQHEKHEIQNLFRPMDIVRVEITALIPLLCSTVGDDLGVLMAHHEGHLMTPISWTEMKTKDGETIPRKVAKP
jgi:exosome complex RNA-binding protein Csl4